MLERFLPHSCGGSWLLTPFSCFPFSSLLSHYSMPSHCDHGASSSGCKIHVTWFCQEYIHNIKQDSPMLCNAWWCKSINETLTLPWNGLQCDLFDLRASCLNLISCFVNRQVRMILFSVTAWSFHLTALSWFHAVLLSLYDRLRHFFCDPVW
jgi:hypothetical protein